jgi:outer membrane protein OmpA-like peptidoglycan-associated protein
VVVIYGKVFDAHTQTPLQATIYYEDLATGKELGMATAHPSNGEYKIVLPYGQYYGFRAEASKHIAVSQSIDISQKGHYIEVERNLYMVPLAIGQTVRINNVFFEKGMPNLLPSSFTELDRLVKIMKDNPTMEIRIEGHTDAVGDPMLLMRLSKERAGSVRNYFISKGIDPSRLSEAGYGRTKPIAPNTTEENRHKNRRVEFVIVKL